MYISDEIIGELGTNTRPVVIMRNATGEAVFGFVMRPGEFITTLPQICDALEMAGLMIVEDARNPI